MQCNAVLLGKNAIMWKKIIKERINPEIKDKKL